MLTPIDQMFLSYLTHAHEGANDELADAATTGELVRWLANLPHAPKPRTPKLKKGGNLPYAQTVNRMATFRGPQDMELNPQHDHSGCGRRPDGDLPDEQGSGGLL